MRKPRYQPIFISSPASTLGKPLPLLSSSSLPSRSLKLNIDPIDEQRRMRHSFPANSQQVPAAGLYTLDSRGVGMPRAQRSQ